MHNITIKDGKATIVIDDDTLDLMTIALERSADNWRARGGNMLTDWADRLDAVTKAIRNAQDAELATIHNEAVKNG